MTTERFSQVPGRPVVASDTAESIGAVKSLVLQPDARRIEAVHIDGRGTRAVVISWDAIDAFGVDAVIASSSSDPTRIETEHERDAVRGVVSMIGTRVMTTEGTTIGTVDDVEFDSSNGKVTSVLTDHGPIDPRRLRAIGSFALIVDPEDSAT